MKKRIMTSALCLALLLVLSGQVFAAESVDTMMDYSSASAAGGARAPQVLVNGVALEGNGAIQTIGGSTYVSLRAVAEALCPGVQIAWAGSQLQVQAEGLFITVGLGERYLVANGRYLYIPEGIYVQNGVTLVPVVVLAKAMGATVTLDSMTGDLMVVSGSGPIQSGESYYDSSAIYWLSRIIHAESGNQPLEGKIAVGTVILNRVEHPLFPDTIYDVIFQSNQFGPASSGSINRTPNEASVIAAKLCLDGAREAEDSLYFNRAGLSCWASRNRTLVITIGDHSFYE